MKPRILYVPLFIAADCVLWTANAVDDALAAFRAARILRCTEIPPFDPAFGAALRELSGT